MPNQYGIEDRFHRALHERLQQQRANRMAYLASGGAFRTVDDTKTVAEKYAEQTAYLQALSDILDQAAEIEKQFYGPSEPRQEEI